MNDLELAITAIVMLLLIVAIELGKRYIGRKPDKDDNDDITGYGV